MQKLMTKEAVVKLLKDNIKEKATKILNAKEDDSNYCDVINEASRSVSVMSIALTYITESD